MVEHAGRIEVSGLSKNFGATKAVDNLSFVVEPGSVTGFLGPNGAGKTTTLRMLLGLVTPASGMATIGGRRYADLERPNSTVGAVLESSSFHPSRSGRNHLRVYCAVNGYPEQRADEVLDLVGLTDAARRSVRGYSLGMRQRLGLAAALLGDPPVLLLDEPANGLDPPGIAWLRGFLRTLADQGRTILVSSHVLSEVQQTADRIVIINQGQLVREGTLDDLTAGHGQAVIVRSPHAERFATVIIGITSEFRHQTVTPTFLATPRRGTVVAAKMMTYAIVGVGYALTCVAVAVSVALPWLAAKDIDVSLGSSGIPQTLLGVGADVAIYAVLGVGLGALLKNQIAAVVGLLVYVLIIGPILGAISAIEGVTRFLPNQAEAALLQSTPPGDSELLVQWQGGLVLIGWALLFAVIGYQLTVRRDVT